MNRLSKISVCLGAMLLIALFSAGCVKDIGNTVGQLSSTVEQTVKGDYYLKSKKYNQGQKSFSQEVRENPDSALARYYYGRFLLQAGEDKQALKQLKLARDLEPTNADYLFWTGVAYGENGNKQQEASQYRAALRQDKKHLQSLIYLGHSQLESKQYVEALATYNRSLAIWPGSPSSLYNRALILRKLNRTPEEKVALHEYLSRYPTGAMARRATIHLNALGDYSYRNHHLGARTVTTEKIWFQPLSAELSPASEESLHVIGSVIQNMPDVTLQIVFFQKNNRTLAQTRALAIKYFIQSEFPGIGSGRIGVSWFGEPQVISIKKKKRRIEESASFFTSVKN